VHEIVKAFPDVPVQVGGGIRDEDTIQTYLDAGVQYVIIGTKAVNAPHFVSDICLSFPGHIIIGLDAKDGKVGIVGYEIPFNRHFYEYVPPRPLEEIDKELDAVTEEIITLLQEIKA